MVVGVTNLHNGGQGYSDSRGAASQFLDFRVPQGFHQLSCSLLPIDKMSNNRECGSWFNPFAQKWT